MDMAGCRHDEPCDDAAVHQAQRRIPQSCQYQVQALAIAARMLPLPPKPARVGSLREGPWIARPIGGVPERYRRGVKRCCLCRQIGALAASVAGVQSYHGHMASRTPGFAKVGAERGSVRCGRRTKHRPPEGWRAMCGQKYGFTAPQGPGSAPERRGHSSGPAPRRPLCLCPCLRRSTSPRPRSMSMPPPRSPPSPPPMSSSYSSPSFADFYLPCAAPYAGIQVSQAMKCARASGANRDCPPDTTRRAEQPRLQPAAVAPALGGWRALARMLTMAGAWAESGGGARWPFFPATDCGNHRRRVRGRAGWFRECGPPARRSG